MSRSDPFVDHKHRDFELLRRSRRRNLLWLGLLSLIAALVISLLYNLIGSDQSGAIRASRAGLIASGVEWSSELLEQERLYRDWLEAHGIDLELKIYNALSDLMLRGALTIAQYQGESEQAGFLIRSYVALDFAALRIGFMLLACWRIWFLAIVVMIGWTYLHFSAYQGNDLLGQTGNGRHFYSGIRGALENLNSRGVPELQVTGLVCPSSVSEQEARASSLGRILENEGIANETNVGLVSILVSNANYPAFIPKPEEQEKFDACFTGGNLLQATESFLCKALELHAQYAQSNFSSAADVSPMEGEGLRSLERVDLEEYSHLLKQTLHRSLTPRMRKLVGQLDRTLMATVVLAYQAGKSLAYDNHSGMWVRASAFSQLTARAVLHSVPAFSVDYNAEARRLIRSALIYASRSSIYGPVRFDRNMSDESRALRQWVEVLMACPHQLDQVGDEVELFGFVSSIHATWKRMIFEHLQNLGAEVKSRIFASQTNLLIVPVDLVVKAMRGIVSREELERMGELILSVSRQQGLRSATLDPGNESVNTGVPVYERIFAPLSDDEIGHYHIEHGVAKDIIRDWSSFRIVLNAYGWLARRVGDYSVPESSIIFSILKTSSPDSRANELGLIGTKGVIAIRGSRFEEHWGSQWTGLFQEVRSANMADNAELYGRLMAGIQDTAGDGFEGAAVA